MPAKNVGGNMFFYKLVITRNTPAMQHNQNNNSWGEKNLNTDRFCPD